MRRWIRRGSKRRERRSWVDGFVRGADEWVLEDFGITTRAVLSWTGSDLDVDGVTDVGRRVEAGRAEESKVLRDRAVPTRRRMTKVRDDREYEFASCTHLHR